MSFQNRIAVITGAAGMIGRRLCREFGKAGVTVVMADMNAEGLVRAEEELRKEGITAYSFPMDIADSESVKKAAEKILKQFGKVDILINNAGFVKIAPFMATDEALWAKIIDVNLNGLFRVTMAFIHSMLDQKYGRIINIGSIAGEVGLPGAAAYSASKGGVILLTKTLAMEMSKQGITVNSISPGWITPEKKPIDATWVGYTGTGDEIARAAVFLASDEAWYMTGVDLPVDGGRILGPHNCRFGEQ